MTASRSLVMASVVLIAAGCGAAVPATPALTDSPTSPPATSGEPTDALPAPTQVATSTNEPAGSPAADALPDLARIASGETPTGWQEVTSADGACRMAVPADWDTETMQGAAIAPGFGAQAMLSSDPLANWGSWEAYLEAAKTAYFGADRVVLIETGEIFLMSAGPSTPGASFIVGRNRGETACGILLTVSGNEVEALLAAGQQVLYSLASTN